MIAKFIRCLLLVLILSDCTDNYLLASVLGPRTADEVCDDQCFIPIALGYKIEILKKIEKPFEVAAPMPVVALDLMAPHLLHELQELSPPPLLGAEALYVFMSLQL